MKYLCLSFLILIGIASNAQHEHPTDTIPQKTGSPHTHHPQGEHEQAAEANNHVPAHENNKSTDTLPSMDHHHMSHDNMTSPMSHSFSLNLPMSRNGSGTGWLPDASPMYGYMKHAGKWMYMFHGSAFLRYNNQDFTNKGLRGDDKIDAPNWFMIMGQRNTGKKGLFHFSGMFSLDDLISGGSGYPLLFQTGESYKGQALVDRQHPHDFISELSVSYSYAINKKTDVFGFIGYPGEPALGPVTFMHRPSSLDNPNAPISHHWVDATHITFGVATIGVRYGNAKIEASSFTGREPNENRYDFDKTKFDSWSGRISFNPTKNWALQASHGFVKSPEALHPDEDVNKTTASAIYNTDIKGDNYVSMTALWGMNKFKDRKGENAFLAEATWHLNRAVVYSRYEFTEKSAEELILDEEQYGHHDLYNVNALTIGFNYDFLKNNNTRLAAGTNLSIYATPDKLKTLYGNYPLSFQVYLRLYPGMMRM